MRNLYFICLFNFIGGVLGAQEQTDTITIDQNIDEVSYKAFDKIIQRDLNFLLFENIAPQQGISFTANDKGSQLNLSGILYSGYKGIYTINAELSSTKGVYLFDEDGGEKGTVTFNYFKAYHRKYFRKSIEDQDKMRGAHFALEKIFHAYAKLDTLKTILDKGTNEPEIESNYLKAKTKLQSLSRTHLNSQDVHAFGQLDNFSYKMVKSKAGDKTVKITYDWKPARMNVKKKYDLKSLERFCEHIEYIHKKLEEELIEYEIQTAKKNWETKHTVFFSLHPYYTRESLDLYEIQDDFSNSFQEISGDLYGIKINFLNYSYERLAKMKWWRPHQFFLQVGGNLGRISNRSNFREQQLAFIDTLETSNGTVQNITSRTGFTSPSGRYQYGIGFGLHTAVYVFPWKYPFGLFGQISYSDLNFSSGSGVSDSRTIPLRAGFLLNLKNKKKDVDRITIQAFADRSNLRLDPSASDDWRFGIGVGLPIKF
ncbi:hypothetical protein [Nonlabens spongiae]|nr:hypothetical protein [Nonlabens spongiae]